VTDFLMPRRKFLTGLFGLIAAPAVVKAANIMPVKVIELPPPPVGFRRLTLDDYRKSGIIRLSELREILRPGAQKMFDDLYEANSAQWENVFESRGMSDD
jgi:hypothetical protein